MWSLIEAASWTAGIIAVLAGIFFGALAIDWEPAEAGCATGVGLVLVILLLGGWTFFFGFPGSSDDPGASASPAPSGALAPPEGEGEGDSQQTRSPEPDPPGDSGLSYADPVEVPWSLQFLGDGCGSSSNTYPSKINFDELSGDDDPGENDLIYEVHSSCSENTRLYTSSDGKGGVVLSDQATDAIDCRTAAITSSLPSYLRPDTRKSLRIVEGNALCLVTDRGRVVRATIDNITVGKDVTKSRIMLMDGTALIWEPTE